MRGLHGAVTTTSAIVIALCMQDNKITRYFFKENNLAHACKINLDTSPRRKSAENTKLEDV